MHVSLRSFLAVTLTLTLAGSAVADTVPATFPARQTLVKLKSTARSTTLLDLLCLKPLINGCEEFQLRQVSIYKSDDQSTREEKTLVESLSTEELVKRIKLSIMDFPITDTAANASNSAAFLITAPMLILGLSLVVPPLAIMLPFAIAGALLGLAVLPVALLGDGIKNAVLKSKLVRWKRVSDQAIKGELIKRPLKMRESILFEYFATRLSTEVEN